jgi:uncharacterized protein
MIVDLTNLEKSVLDFEFSLASETIDLEREDAKLVSAVEIKGKLTKGIVALTVEGKISSVAGMECTRCLQPVEHKLHIPFKTEFITAENYTAAKEAELQEQDLDTAVYEGDKIDLTEIVREQILLNLPEQVFCKENCRGLCEKCGANRNLIDCNCIEKEFDPRWSALRELKSRN